MCKLQIYGRIMERGGTLKKRKEMNDKIPVVNVNGDNGWMGNWKWDTQAMLTIEFPADNPLYIHACTYIIPFDIFP